MKGLKILTIVFKNFEQINSGRLLLSNARRLLLIVTRSVFCNEKILKNYNTDSQKQEIFSMAAKM